MKERDLKQIFELACTLRRLRGMLAVSSKDQKSVRLGFGRGASCSMQPETKGHEEENKGRENTVSSEQKERRGELARNENHRDTRRVRKQTRTKENVVQCEAAEDGSMAEA
jgi:hypothetical protein